MGNEIGDEVTETERQRDEQGRMKLKRKKHDREEKKNKKAAELKAVDDMAVKIFQQTAECSACTKKEKKLEETEAKYVKLTKEFQELVLEQNSNKEKIERLEKDLLFAKTSKMSILGIYICTYIISLTSPITILLFSFQLFRCTTIYNTIKCQIFS